MVKYKDNIFLIKTYGLRLNKLYFFSPRFADGKFVTFHLAHLASTMYRKLDDVWKCVSTNGLLGNAAHVAGWMMQEVRGGGRKELIGGEWREEGGGICCRHSSSCCIDKIIPISPTSKSL